MQGAALLLDGSLVLGQSMSPELHVLLGEVEAAEASAASSFAAFP